MKNIKKKKFVDNRKQKKRMKISKKQRTENMKNPTSNKERAIVIQRFRYESWLKKEEVWNYWYVE